MTANSTRRRRSRKRSTGARRRRSNPFALANSGGRTRKSRRNPTFARRRHRGGRRRNPAFAIAGYNGMALIKLGAGAAAGAIGTRALTQLVLKDKNTGAMGYAANAGAALALGWVTARFVDNDTAAGVFAGGIGAIILRIWNERVSQTSAAALSGLGDIDFSDDGLGMYLPSTNPPQVGAGGYYQVAPAANSGAPGAAAVPSRLQRRF